LLTLIYYYPSLIALFNNSTHIYINTFKRKKMSKLNKYTYILPILILAASCATSISMMPYSERMQGETESSTELRAYVGDLVFSKYDYVERFEGRASASFKIQGLKVQANDVLYARNLVEGSEGACTNQTVMSTPGMMTPAAAIGMHCLYDSDNDGLFDAAYALGYKGKIDNPINMPAWVTSAATTGTKKELIYQGVEGNTLRLRYREFFRDIVRPSYDQTVEYNLDETTEISFRGLGITIVEADNQYLLYTIDSGTLEL